MFLGNVSNFEEYVEYQKELFAEMGFDSFSYEAREEVIDQFVNKKYFQDYMYDYIKEGQEWYDEDEWQELCEKYECDSYEEAADKELFDYMEYEDGIDWFRRTHGEDSFENEILANDLLDYENMAKWIMEQDGIKF